MRSPATAGRGRFIVFEGGDGAGKSTQVRLLTEALQGAGRSVVATRQPGGEAVGTRIREILLDPNATLSDRCEALLYAADKAQHVDQVVHPALQQGSDVVCDRYVDSMLAYQGPGRGEPAQDLARLAAWATGALEPDLTVVLDMDPADALAGKAELDRLESAGLEFHRRVRQGFLDLAAATPERYLVLPAREPVHRIAAQVLAAVEALG